MISIKKGLIDLHLTIKLAPGRAKNSMNQKANVTHWLNYRYLPKRAEIWIIQQSHLAPQRAKNTVACKQALRMGYSEICFRIATGRVRERACNDPCMI